MARGRRKNEDLQPEVIEAVRLAGYVILPARPSDEILEIIAEHCFQAPNGKWDAAKRDAADAYAALVAIGIL